MAFARRSLHRSGDSRDIELFPLLRLARTKPDVLGTRFLYGWERYVDRHGDRATPELGDCFIKFLPGAGRGADAGTRLPMGGGETRPSWRDAQLCTLGIAVWVKSASCGPTCNFEWPTIHSG